MIKAVLVVTAILIGCVVIPLTIETILENRRIKKNEGCKRSKKDD